MFNAWFAEVGVFIVEIHFKVGNAICLKFPEPKNLIYLSVQCIFK